MVYAAWAVVAVVLALLEQSDELAGVAFLTGSALLVAAALRGLAPTFMVLPGRFRALDAVAAGIAIVWLAAGLELLL
jgi:hypothetical protein